MRIALVVAVAMVCSTASFAEGEVFAVLPTEATGDAGPEAQIATSMMTRALQRESLMLASADDVSQRSCVHAVVDRLVGAKVKATKVIVSSLWATADGSKSLLRWERCALRWRSAALPRTAAVVLRVSADVTLGPETRRNLPWTAEVERW